MSLDFVFVRPLHSGGSVPSVLPLSKTIKSKACTRGARPCFLVCCQTRTLQALRLGVPSLRARCESGFAVSSCRSCASLECHASSAQLSFNSAVFELRPVVLSWSACNNSQVAPLLLARPQTRQKPLGSSTPIIASLRPIRPQFLTVFRRLLLPSVSSC